MKHTNFFTLTTDIKDQEFQELILAVKAHGGQYKWGKDEEKPIIAVNIDSIEPEPEDVEVLSVSIVDDWLEIVGVDNTYGNPVDFEPNDVFAGHLSFIIDLIPPINGIADVTISAKTKDMEDPWRCVECGSLDIEQKVWIDPNTEKMTAQDGVDSADCWCNDCEEHTSQTLESDLLSRIEDWWTYADYETRVDVTGLFDDMFPSLNEHDKAMKEHWGGLTKEQKMAIWKSKIYGKE